MTPSRKQPGVEFWATMVVVVSLVVYPLSFGPVVWWFPNSSAGVPFGGPLADYAPRAYWPIGWLAKHGPVPVEDAIFWYATLRVSRVVLPADMDGNEWYYSLNRRGKRSPFQ